MTISNVKAWASIISIVLLTGSATSMAQEERKADHDQLRALMKRGAEALNTRNLDAMTPYLHPNFTVITLDNRKLQGIGEFKQYWNSLFEGKEGLKSIETKLETDELMRFLDDNSGTSFGTSNDRYTFNDGDVRDMKSRWSAVVQKDGDTWKLASIHFSANLFDNPVLDATRKAVWKAALLAGIVGLAIGGAAGYLFRRRTPRSP